jgi:hypothetical protein
MKYLIIFLLSFNAIADDAVWPSCVTDIKNYNPDPPKYIPYEKCHVANIMTQCRTEKQIQFLKKVQQTRLEINKHLNQKVKTNNRRTA